MWGSGNTLFLDLGPGYMGFQFEKIHRAVYLFIFFFYFFLLMLSCVFIYDFTTSMLCIDEKNPRSQNGQRCKPNA